MEQYVERILESYIDIRFDEYNESLREAENYFKSQAKEVLPYSDKELSLMEEEQRQDIVQWYAEDYLKYTESLPTTLRNSFLIGFHSLYEYFMYDICNQAKRLKNLSIDIELIKGKGIYRSKEYLEKVCLVQISNTKEWNDIIHINKIRNCIVHNLGKLDNVDKHKQYFIENNKLIELDSHNRVKIKKGYLENVSNIFTKSLFDSIKKVFT